MSREIRDLAARDLHQLGDAIRSGRLSPPFTSISVGLYCSGPNLGPLAAEMQRLTDGGLRTEHLAFLLETLADDRSSRPGSSDSIDLVCTGPEGSGDTSRDTGVVVRELFFSARESVIVAGYAVHQGRQVFRSLADRMEQIPQLKVAMFLDVQRHPTDTSKDSEMLGRFAHVFKTREWPGKRLPEVFYDPRALALGVSKKSSLHAKCIVVDREAAFISSANFTEAAHSRNIEVGVLIRSERVASQLADHFESLASAGLLKPIPNL